MFTDRPLTDQKTQEAMNHIGDVFTYYDLSGGVCVVNVQEWGYGYKWETTWNAFIDDPNTPLGIRIRAREAELGSERAKELITGAAHTMASLKDFGTQTRVWTDDLMKMMNKVGMRIHHIPFNGKKLPRIYGMDLRT